jgi:hypothetical protein
MEVTLTQKRCQSRSGGLGEHTRLVKYGGFDVVERSVRGYLIWVKTCCNLPDNTYCPSPFSFIDHDSVAREVGKESSGECNHRPCLGDNIDKEEVCSI